MGRFIGALISTVITILGFYILNHFIFHIPLESNLIILYFLSYLIYTSFIFHLRLDELEEKL